MLYWIFVIAVGVLLGGLLLANLDIVLNVVLIGAGVAILLSLAVVLGPVQLVVGACFVFAGTIVLGLMSERIRMRRDRRRRGHRIRPAIPGSAKTSATHLSAGPGFSSWLATFERSPLVVVTATTDSNRAMPCIRSWGKVPTLVLVNGRSPHLPEVFPSNIGWLTCDEYLGVVPAFSHAVRWALDHSNVKIIMCVHDDLEVIGTDWAECVTRLFDEHPACGLAGFGGSTGLGSDELYKAPYDPMQLVRIGFRSNLVDAEVHGLRSLSAERVACVDAFCLIGRREFYAGRWRDGSADEEPWLYLEEHGIVHHALDGMMGCLAARYGWETWYSPIGCRHLGGHTTVLDRGYQLWAQQQNPAGDQGFWQQSHQLLAELFPDVLPLRA